jgi:hypothetical protein
MRAAIRLAICLGCASLAFAEIDAFSLRSKYGPPLERETFTVRPAIEMIVDYGPNKQVCRIQLPSGIQYGGAVPDNAITKQRIDEVLNEVVPPSIRGGELNQGLAFFGWLTVSYTLYERLSISEAQDNGVGRGITVTFRDAACSKLNLH